MRIFKYLLYVFFIINFISCTDEIPLSDYETTFEEEYVVSGFLINNSFSIEVSKTTELEEDAVFITPSDIKLYESSNSEGNNASLILDITNLTIENDYTYINDNVTINDNSYYFIEVLLNSGEIFSCEPEKIPSSILQTTGLINTLSNLGEEEEEIIQAVFKDPNLNETDYFLYSFSQYEEFSNGNLSDPISPDQDVNFLVSTDELDIYDDDSTNLISPGIGFEKLNTTNKILYSADILTINESSYDYYIKVYDYLADLNSDNLFGQLFSTPPYTIYGNMYEKNDSYKILGNFTIGKEVSINPTDDFL